MGQKLHFGKSVADNSFGKFRNMLDYKLYFRGKKLITLDKWFASSQLCNLCGYKNSEVKDLSIRSWVCPKCGAHHDRDINAAINLREEGKRINKSTVGTTRSYAFGENVRRLQPVIPVVAQFSLNQEAPASISGGSSQPCPVCGGYSPKTAHSIGAENLTKPEIQEALQKAISERNSKLIADREQRQIFWTNVMLDEAENMKYRLRASELLAKLNLMALSHSK